MSEDKGGRKVEKVKRRREIEKNVRERVKKCVSKDEEQREVRVKEGNTKGVSEQRGGRISYSILRTTLTRKGTGSTYLIGLMIKRSNGILQELLTLGVSVVWMENLEGRSNYLS